MIDFYITDSKKHKKDIEEALDIYIKSVDLDTSYTSTNEIKKYILEDYDDDRLMFFFNLYQNTGKGDEVFGFSEFGYLPYTQTLIIDYICTKQRNAVIFGIFYHLAIKEIKKRLKKRGYNIKYFVCEISLLQREGKYCDDDSNYFRQMLMLEKYSLLRYPYFQPVLNNVKIKKPEKFALAIRGAGENPSDMHINADTYLEIVDEIYKKHYLAWYQRFSKNKSEIEIYLDKLYTDIKKSLINNKNDIISLVNCPIFEAGKCQQVDIQPITLGYQRKHRILLTITVILTSVFIFLAMISVFLVENDKTKWLNKLFSFISLCSSIVTMIVFFSNFFRK